MGLKLKRHGCFMGLSAVKELEKFARSERIVDLQLFRACSLAKQGRSSEAITSLKRAIEKLR